MKLEKEYLSWPISPTFLGTNFQQVTDDSLSPNEFGVFEADTLRGFLADASDDRYIKNPLSLFQVVPLTTKIEKSDNGIVDLVGRPEEEFLDKILGERQIVRIDPKSLYPSFKCCELFRKYNNGGNERKCLQQDNRFLLFFHPNLTHCHYQNNFEEFCNIFSEICSDYNASIGDDSSLINIEIDNVKHRVYAWYQCQYSNLYEYIFPVIHSGKVIAVIMHGQRIPKQFNRLEVFQRYQYKCPDIKKQIEVIPDEWFQEEPMSVARENAIFRRIELLEKRINKEIKQYSMEIASSEFRKIEMSFRKDICEYIESKGSIPLEEYCSILNIALSKICDFFNPNGFIRIYASESTLEKGDDSVTRFYLIGDSENKIRKTLSEREIVFKGINSKNLSYNEHNDLAKYSTRKIILSECDTFRVENLLIGEMQILIWKSYSEWKKDYPIQFELYAKLLISLYHSFLEPYNILRGVELQKQLETAMRVSVHEAANVIPTIYSTLQSEYEFNGKTLERIRDGMSVSQMKRRERTLYDSIQRLLLLDMMYRRSTLIFKNEKPKYEWVDIHREIYSLKTLFSEDAEKSHLQQIIVDIDPTFDKCQLYTDKLSLNHILFNLVDNAVKYGLRASNIYIKVCFPKHYDKLNEEKCVTEINQIKIEVISYGFRISSEIKDKIFDLYYRSEQSKEKEGRGIGLFLVKKLCEKLNYKIENSRSQLIEAYNIPASFHFVNGKNVDSKIEKLPEDIRLILTSNFVGDNIMKLVNVKTSLNWDIGINEIQSLISQETYENIFSLTLNDYEGKLLKIRNINDYE